MVKRMVNNVSSGTLMLFCTIQKTNIICGMFSMANHFWCYRILFFLNCLQVNSYLDITAITRTRFYRILRENSEMYTLEYFNQRLTIFRKSILEVLYVFQLPPEFMFYIGNQNLFDS